MEKNVKIVLKKLATISNERIAHTPTAEPSIICMD